MKYIDIHCHLGFPDYDKDREGIIERMRQNDMTAITVGVDFETSKKEVEIAKKYENIFACVGIHPETANAAFPGFPSPEQGEGWVGLKTLAQNPKVVAIGECGLDYFRLEGDIDKIKSSQKDLFESQIRLALEVNKPLMLHIRPSDKINFDAYFDALEILERRFKESGGKLRGNTHYFVGNLEVLKRFLAIGFTVSFAGAITFAREYDECIKYAPLNSILSETDSPFVAPAPYRGKRNEPVYVIEIVKRLAELKNISVDEMSAEIIRTVNRVFDLGNPDA